jgi:hypothetical protein
MHTRAEAFPLGFAVLTRLGVTAWRRAVADLAPAARAGAPGRAPSGNPTTPPTLPAPRAAELVNALAAVALAGT